ncbi:MAG: S8 family serine peptidase [Pirellulaceae bacterium]|nr:S8 family serine peptidase [Pirellulaceae bacterium]
MAEAWRSHPHFHQMLPDGSFLMIDHTRGLHYILPPVTHRQAAYVGATITESYHPGLPRADRNLGDWTDPELTYKGNFTIADGAPYTRTMHHRERPYIVPTAADLSNDKFKYLLEIARMGGTKEDYLNMRSPIWLEILRRTEVEQLQREIAGIPGAPPEAADMARWQLEELQKRGTEIFQEAYFGRVVSPTDNVPVSPDSSTNAPTTSEEFASYQANNQLLDAELIGPFLLGAFANATAPGESPPLAGLAADPGVADAVTRLGAWDFSTPAGLARVFNRIYYTDEPEPVVPFDFFHDSEVATPTNFDLLLANEEEDTGAPPGTSPGKKTGSDRVSIHPGPPPTPLISGTAPPTGWGGQTNHGGQVYYGEKVPDTFFKSGDEDHVFMAPMAPPAAVNLAANPDEQTGLTPFPLLTLSIDPAPSSAPSFESGGFESFESGGFDGAGGTIRGAGTLTTGSVPIFTEKGDSPLFPAHGAPNPVGHFVTSDPGTRVEVDVRIQAPLWVEGVAGELKAYVIVDGIRQQVEETGSDPVSVQQNVHLFPPDESPKIDTDGDGVPDDEEIKRGTDPHSSWSKPGQLSPIFKVEDQHIFGSNTVLAAKFALFEEKVAGTPVATVGEKEDRVFTIDPDGDAGDVEPFDTYADMTTDGGGWTRGMTKVPGAIGDDLFPLASIAPASDPLFWHGNAPNPDFVSNEEYEQYLAGIVQNGGRDKLQEESETVPLNPVRPSTKIVTLEHFEVSIPAAEVGERGDIVLLGQLFADGGDSVDGNGGDGSGETPKIVTLDHHEATLFASDTISFAKTELITPGTPVGTERETVPETFSSPLAIDSTNVPDTFPGLTSFFDPSDFREDLFEDQFGAFNSSTFLVRARPATEPATGPEPFFDIDTHDLREVQLGARFSFGDPEGLVAEKRRQGDCPLQRSGKQGLDSEFNVERASNGDIVAEVVDQGDVSREDGGVAAKLNEPFANNSDSLPQDADTQWALARAGLNAELLEQLATSSDGSQNPIVVAVIDTGVDLSHPELWGQLWRNRGEIPFNKIDDDRNGYVDDVYGWNTQADRSNIWDDNGHGTHVAGIIAARWDGRGMAGVAPNCRLMIVKAADEEGKTDGVRLGLGIRYAVNNGANIIHISAEAKPVPKLDQYMIDWAQSKGVLVVAAAGSRGRDTAMVSPAGLHGVLTVGACRKDDKRATISGWGHNVDLVAPGIDILSLRAHDTDFMFAMAGEGLGIQEGDRIVDQRWYRADGTSFAAPLVTGVAAAFWARDPSLTGEQIKQKLIMNCDDLGQPGWDRLTGAGRLNAAKAFAAPAGRSLVSKVHEATIQDRNGRPAVVVTGEAYGNNFGKRTLQVAFGDSPSESDWKTVSSSDAAVENGELGAISGAQFDQRGAWYIRCLVNDSDGNTQESRLKVTLK